MRIRCESASATRFAGVNRSSPYKIMLWLQSSISTVAQEHGAQGHRVLLLVAPERPARLGGDADRASRGAWRGGDISDWTNTGDLSAIEALFASLDTQDADLIVAGAFGHSRLYEGLFGGVSLDLMRQQSLPVLMSH